MIDSSFDPWKNINEFYATEFAGKSGELKQWPVKLRNAPVVSPYYHHAHLLIAADCSAFIFPEFHEAYACGKVTLSCCMETDDQIEEKLENIILCNDIVSITVLKAAKDCCNGLGQTVIKAANRSKLPIPVKVSSVSVLAEDVNTNEDTGEN